MKNKKIYLVTSGEYSDFGVDAVFTSKKKAQDFIDTSPIDYGYNIAVYDLDPVNIMQREGVNWHLIHFNVMTGYIYHITQLKEDYVNAEEQNQPAPCGYGSEFRYRVWVKAKDKDHAVKIVGDIRRELKLKLGYEG